MSIAGTIYFWETEGSDTLTSNPKLFFDALLEVSKTRS